MARSSLMPGFRFHPTDVELVMYYLKNKLLGKKIIFNAVAEVNIYDFCPWDLPDKSSIKSGDLEWYFFCHKSKKYSSGGRTNRATKSGYWKATGKDRKVKFNERNVATIKTLVFYLGHAGKGGQRTDWVMHEYRMDDEKLASEGIVQDTYVLCKVFQKSGSGPKNGAQYGAPFNEEEWDDDMVSSLDPQAIFGPLGASITTDHKQKGPAITNMSEPGSSSVTFSENEHTNALNYKQKGPATTDMTEPGSSVVTFSSNEPTNVTEQGPTTMNMTEPGSSGVALATANEMPANNDVMFLADLDMIMGGLPEGAANLEKDKAMGPNEDDDIYGDLVNFWNLEDLEGHNNKTDEAEYILGELISPDDDDIGLGKFYVD